MRRLKGFLLGWIYQVAAWLPPTWAVLLVNRTWPWGRPVLDYLEFHLADHCNLNCAGCTHFAPYADKRFADIKQVERDFTRLKTLFKNIRHIRIMGGEPLLHPEAAVFVRLVRNMFPHSKVRLVTNGIKLLEGSDYIREVLAAMRENEVGMDWTLYPPLERRREEVVRLCAENGVNLRISENSSFLARMRPRGNMPVAKSFSWCRKFIYCPLLDNGHIYICAQAHYIGYYNRVAGTSVASDAGIDIYTASAREILLYLMRPSLACAYCDAGMRNFEWKNRFRPEDWWR